MLNKIKETVKKNDLSIYKLIWCFAIVSFMGWAIENVWYVIKWHKFVYNQGMVWGPFQQIYGFGAVIITLLSSLLKDKKKITIFIWGAVSFGLFEYLSGAYLEIFTSTFSWDYSRVGYNFVIGKYVYLPYCLVWGVFTIVWTNVIQNKLLKLLNILTTNKMKYITILVGIFFTLNLFLTAVATNRFVARTNNIAANNSFEKAIDNTFDNEYFKKWMPKIRVIAED